MKGRLGFGLACAGRLRSGGSVRFGRRQLGVLLAGGAIVIISSLLNAGLVLQGGIPTDFAWPIFAAGMAIGVIAAWTALTPVVNLREQSVSRAPR